MLHRLAPIAAANARAEADDLAASAGHPIAPWDRAFHAERVRRERFAVDAAALRPYLELERVLHDGVFHAARRLYGLSFAERHDLPTYHPDVRVFDVSDEDGPLGLFVADLYARDTKRGGAWMNAFVSQSHLHGTRPVVLNTLNIPKPADGEPTLLTLELGAHPLPRVRPRPARPVLRRALPDVRRARPCRATSSSTPRRSTRCGWRTRRSSPPTPATTRPASRCPPELVDPDRGGPPLRRGRGDHRVPGRRRCSTRRGTGSAPTRPSPTSRRSKPPR